LQYIEVQLLDDDSDPGVVPLDGEAAWARVGAEIVKAWERLFLVRGAAGDMLSVEEQRPPEYERDKDGNCQ
jgi:hypothetical protein